MKPSKLAILYPFVFFIATSMFVRSWVPFFYNSAWLVLLVGCVLSMFIASGFMRTKWFICFVVYSLVVLLNLFYGDEYFNRFNTVVNECAMFFLLGAFIYYIYNADDKRCINITYYLMFVMVLIAAIGSFMANSIIPGIVRAQEDIFMNGQGDRMDLLVYYRMGMSNYMLPHGLPAIIPPLILLIKRTRAYKIERLIAIVFLLATVLLVYLSGSTTALLLSVAAAFTVFMDNNKKNLGRLPIILTIAVLPILLFPEIITFIIGLFSSETAETYAYHIEDMMSYSSSGSSGNTSLRMTLYKMSLGGFFQNPLWGSAEPMSGHSVLLDRLGSLGLIGFIPFLLYFYFIVKFLKTKLGTVEMSYLKVSFLIGLGVLLIKGIYDIEIWLMFIVVAPVLLYKSSHLANKRRS